MKGKKMSIADFLKETKEKYQPKEMVVELTPCSTCKNSYALTSCLRCGACGREFKDGKLIKEAEDEK